MTLIVLLLAIGVCYRNARHNRSFLFIKDRQTIETLQNKTGTVMNMGSDDDPVYIISYDEEHISLFPCNLPEAYRQHNRAVTFSGDVKYMYPLEDEYGQFFEVKNIAGTP